jgi:exonuclease VII small subunit
MWKPMQVETPATQTAQTDAMARYTDALNQFRKAATAFLQHVDLLAQARNAYEQAMTSSAELRNVLNAGDETLRGLMTQLEQSVNNDLSKPTFARKRPEPVRVEPTMSGESTGTESAFP